MDLHRRSLVACDGDDAMSIKAGDLVMVVKPTICCGRAIFGKPFTAGPVRMSTDPSWCGWCSTANAATMITELPDGTVIPLWRLKKIPPLSELEGKERERELVLK
jgi:hypothetical protein